MKLKIKRSVLILIVLAAIVIGGYLWEILTTPTLAELISSADNCCSIVEVKSGFYGEFRGTGYVAANGRVVTVGHVIRPFSQTFVKIKNIW